jgi:hypothetical protein
MQLFFIFVSNTYCSVVCSKQAAKKLIEAYAKHQGSDGKHPPP